MDIQLFCNPICQASRAYEKFATLPIAKGLLKVNIIPDFDARLPQDDFKLKYGTPKYPFAKVDGQIVESKDLYNFIHVDFIKSLNLSTSKIEEVP
jgi:hypothetical protein